MHASGSGLSLILGPVPESEFFSDYWEQTPLHVSRTDPAHFAPQLSLEMIETLLSSQALSFPAVQLVNRNTPVESSAYTDESRRIIPHRLLEYHHAGATIVVSQAHDRIPALASFRRIMQSALQLRCQTNVYLSPPGKQGFNAHYDSHDVFILQVGGSKTFNFYGGGVELPYTHDDFDASRHPCGELQQSILVEAGDTLYIPRGVMHDAVANDNSSLHITLGVYAVTMRDALLEMVQQLTQQDLRFRHSVPRNWLLPQAIDQGRVNTLPANVLAPTFTEHQLRQAISALADTAAIESAPDCSGMLTRESTAAEPILSLSSRVRLKRSLLISVERSGTVLRCRTHGQVLEFEDPLCLAIDALLDGNERAVAELQSLQDTQKLAVCDRLLQANLLEIV